MMTTNLKQLLTLLCFFTFFSGLMAQNGYWTQIKEAEVSQKQKLDRNTQPDQFQIYHLDIDLFKQALAEAPLRGQIQGKSSLEIELPSADGHLERYRVTESPIMPEGLASRFEMIKTYSAVGIDDPTATVRFSLTQFGVHSMELSARTGQTYIDPYTADYTDFMVYRKTDIKADLSEFECYTDGAETFDVNDPDQNYMTPLDTDDSTLRKYRLALSTHPTYGDIFSQNADEGEEKASIMAEMVIAVNRVNGIFERDLAITLEFVENNDDLIFYSAMNENPWDGADGFWDYYIGTFNSRTQNINDDIIGDENYDIGHNFNTSGGGNAGCLSCVCVSGQKGSGYTGLPNPVGDPFYVDFVAHEMGHQFGGYHVMNTCSRSGNGQTEVEPASGSSVMGYAGVCDTNIQNHSDAYFNYVNIRDISANIQIGNSTCGELIDIENLPPTADAGDNYTIPVSTAFVLTGSATDPDGMETLTYSWDQNDPAQAATSGPLNPNLTQGALYRSVPPKEVPYRYFPDMSHVLNGNLTPNWEMTPAVGRNLKFSFTVRDNGSGLADAIGQTASDLMSIVVDGTAGPFEVISHDEEGLIIAADHSAEILWDVANTDNDNINAQEVDILLSIDGGENFDIILGENLPNTGEALVDMPDLEVEEARLMIRASDNIFFAVNKKTFSISQDMGVEDFKKSSVQLYPNPSNGNFTLEMDADAGQSVAVKIYNLQGKLVYEKQFEGNQYFQQEINMENAETGMYILRIENDGKTTNKKLLIK